MAKAKKLPSGNWRVQVFSGYTYEKGKKKRTYRSFTAPTRKEAEYNASVFAYKRKEPQRASESLREASEKYIASRSEILSPASIRKYLTIQRRLPKDLADKKISEIDNACIQEYINKLSEDHSPKTVRDYHGFLSAVLKYSEADISLHTKMPSKRRTERHIPSDEDVEKIIKAVKGTDMEVPVYLAAFGTLRRGEVCALTVDDIGTDRIHVCKAMTYTPDARWVIKTPKTYAGDRYVRLPDFVMDLLRKRKCGRIVKKTPNEITSAFEHVCNKAGVEHFRFHDLRHYCASVAHALGIPDAYIMQMGGWGNDRVLKDVYRHAFSDVQEEMADKIDAHFESMQHEMQHGIKKSQ